MSRAPLASAFRRGAGAAGTAEAIAGRRDTAAADAIRGWPRDAFDEGRGDDDGFALAGRGLPGEVTPDEAAPVSADALWLAANAAPIPRATANAPTRPTYRAAPMALLSGILP